MPSRAARRPVSRGAPPARSKSSTATPRSSRERAKSTSLAPSRSKRSSRPVTRRPSICVVGGQQPTAEVVQQPLEGGAGPRAGLAQHEVLDAVRGHDGRVVALGVGRQEVVAEDLHVDLGGHQERARAVPVDGDAGLAVADRAGAHRGRGGYPDRAPSQRPRAPIWCRPKLGAINGKGDGMARPKRGMRAAIACALGAAAAVGTWAGIAGAASGSSPSRRPGSTWGRTTTAAGPRRTTRGACTCRRRWAARSRPPTRRTCPRGRRWPRSSTASCATATRSSSRPPSATRTTWRPRRRSIPTSTSSRPPAPSRPRTWPSTTGPARTASTSPAWPPARRPRPTPSATSCRSPSPRSSATPTRSRSARRR